MNADPASRGRTQSLAQLVAARVLDPELAALLWLLAEARLPFVVAGPTRSGRSTIRAVLLDLLPEDTHRVMLAGEDEDFEWLPEAAQLGWRHERAADSDMPPSPTGSIGSAGAASTVVVADLGDVPGGTWGPRARVALRALSLGYGMAATIGGDGLDEVVAALKAPPVAADDNELSRLGIVLVMGSPGVDRAAPGDDVTTASAPHRVAAAHYVRPVVRDVHGHVQRMPPAVLATWDPRTDRFEHFAWGIVGELAERTGRRPVEFEREQARRAGELAARIVVGRTV